MGFRTLAIQKRTSEVWNVLTSVKTEFAKFEGMMSKAHKTFQKGLGELDEVMGVRTRVLQRQLDKVDAINYSSDKNFMILDSDITNTDE